MYPDHCVYFWGKASLEERKIAMADWNKPLPLEEVDGLSGEWGFEEKQSEGIFQISLE